MSYTLWPGSSVHVFNAVTAWLDLLLGAPRSFSARSRQMSTAITLVYTQWILVCRVANNGIPLSLHEQNALSPGTISLTSVARCAYVMHCLTVCRRCAGLLLCEHFCHTAAVCSFQYRQISEQEAWEVSPTCKKSCLA